MTVHFTRALSLTVLGLVLVCPMACATRDPATLPATLQQLKARQIHVLARRCYAYGEDARAATGGLEAWLACKAWADRLIR
jgi:hypothetical protein